MQISPVDLTADVYEKSCLLSTICADKGTVWIAKHKSSQTRYAVKIYDLDKCREEWDWIQKEITMVRKLNHKNLINYLATFTFDQQLWIVMPLIGFTSASRLVATHFHEGFPEAALVLVMRDVLHGLHYLHSKGIIHRSIKGSHILVSSEGRSLLSGFRHSTSALSSGKWEKYLHSYPAEAAYNLNWASPEMLKQDMDGYCEKTDIYSLGITMCELGNGEVPYRKYEPQLMLVEKLFGREPFLFDSNTYRYMTGNGKDSGVGGSYGDYLASLPKISEKYFSVDAHQFVSLCLMLNLNLRPSVDRLLLHSFIKQAKKLDVKLPELLHPVTPIKDDTDIGNNDMDSLERSIDRMCIDAEVMWDL